MRRSKVPWRRAIRSLASWVDIRHESAPSRVECQPKALRGFIGTLDLLILKILTLGPNHGWGIANRIRQISRDGLNASQGSLYPALHRLEMSGDVRSEMTSSEFTSVALAVLTLSIGAT
jgi:hypothetical protein